MTDFKKWYRSKTIWGAAVALAAAVAGMFGIAVDAGTGAELASTLADLAAAAGALVAILGRLDAKTAIG